jgi:hypothetical protein
MQPTTITCQNCGNRFQGPYCNICGEQVYHEHDKRFAHFIEEAFHFITHFDTKYFQSFWLIFSRPGFLAQQYSQGRRKKYFSPVSFFMIGVVIYLLFPLMQGMNISFASHLSNNNGLHFHALQRWAQHKALAEHVSLEQIAEKFDHISPKISKVLLVILIPMSALVLALLFNRGRHYYYFDHLMFAAEFNSFYLYSSFFLLPLLVILISRTFGLGLDAGDNAFFLTFQGLIILLALTTALKRFYQLRFFIALLYALLFLVLYLITILIYRYILFAFVMLFI